MVTFKATIPALNFADSEMPMIRIMEITRMMKMAGRLTTPPSNGDLVRAGGKESPKVPRSLTRYFDQLTDTVAAPTAYSSVRSQQIIHASSSPMVAYA